MEVVVAGQRRITSSVGNFRVTVGVGAGILPGYGAPLFRGIMAFDYLNREPFDDDDHDGIVNVNDKCPGQPEDLDDFEDSDGCPELDNDGDGIEDVDDECPNEPEDKDNVDDFDGCPEVSELDSDLDGVTDDADKCPESAEDFDGFQDDDGCLDPDNDGDGLSDLNDLCPNEYEDQATSPDKDGCPPGYRSQGASDTRAGCDHHRAHRSHGHWRGDVSIAGAQPSGADHARAQRDHQRRCHGGAGEGIASGAASN